MKFLLLRLKWAGTILLWIAIIAGSAYFIRRDVFSYFNGFRSQVFGDTLFRNQLFVSLHMIGGTLALAKGPLQFWKGFRNRYPTYHRTAGKLYVLACLLVSFSAFRTAFFSLCRPCTLSLFISAVLLLVTTLIAYFSARRRSINIHRQFMVRSYVLIIAFILVRLYDEVPLDILFGTIEDPGHKRAINEYFFTFFPPLCAEIALTWWPQIKALFAVHR